MKRSLLSILAISVALLSSCTSHLYPEVDERLSNIPTQPHNNQIEVFFAGEWPQEEYIKLAAVESRGGGQVAYIDLVKHIQMKARRYGADAVIIQEKNLIPNVHTSAGTSNIETTSWSVLTGIAIKYKRNLEMGLMPKWQQLEIFDPASGVFEPLLHLEFYPTGEIKSKEENHIKATDLYNNYIRNYSLRYLKETGPGWSHQLQEGYVVARELHKGGVLQKRIDFEYDRERRVKRIHILDSRGATEEIHYSYSETGQVAQRKILINKEPHLWEEYLYDDSGKVQEMRLHHSSLPDNTPFIRSTYTYYTLEEI